MGAGEVTVLGTSNNTESNNNQVDTVSESTLDTSNSTEYNNNQVVTGV